MKSKMLKIPGLGRIGLVGERSLYGQGQPSVDIQTEVGMTMYRNGKQLRLSEFTTFWERFWAGSSRNDYELSLGSGVLTNVAALSRANCVGWSPIGIDTMRLAKWHFVGTGTTAPTTSDIKLETPSAYSGSSGWLGSQSLTTEPNLHRYVSSSIVEFTGSEMISEWGLFTGQTYELTTGSPVVSSTQTSATLTGVGLTASSPTVQGMQQHILHDTTADSWGLITANSTSVVTVPAWYKAADGTNASLPALGDVTKIRPVMVDRRTFTPRPAESGMAIGFTFRARFTDGG